MYDHGNPLTRPGHLAPAACAAVLLLMGGCATAPQPPAAPEPPSAMAPEAEPEEFGVIRTCNAAYPPDAGGVEGRVEMTFQVSIQGEPFNIAVVASEPAGVFDAVATEALACWRFQPELDTSRVRRVIIDFVP